MSFNLYTQFLQMLHNGAIDGTAEIRVLISNGTRLVTDVVVHILEDDSMLALMQQVSDSKRLMTCRPPSPKN